MRRDSIGWLVGCYFRPPPSLQSSSRIDSLTTCDIYIYMIRVFFFFFLGLDWTRFLAFYVRIVVQLASPRYTPPPGEST